MPEVSNYKLFFLLFYVGWSRSGLNRLLQKILKISSDVMSSSIGSATHGGCLPRHLLTQHYGRSKLSSGLLKLDKFPNIKRKGPMLPLRS